MDTAERVLYFKGGKNANLNAYVDFLQSFQHVAWCLRLAENVVTPTTKAADHDVPISPAQIVAQGLMSQEDWDTVGHPAKHL